MTPLEMCIWLCAGVTVAVWVASLITREYSWTDRVWSLAPIAYVWIFALFGGQNPRLVLMAVLVTAWGARLTYNFARKGGYRAGGEDYRWARLRQMMPPWAFAVFNLLFIALYQNVLILGITLPAVTVQENASPLGPWDALLVVAFLGALVGETVADEEQWDFHCRKANLAAQGLEADPPFCTTGMFAWSRHPNYFFEQAQWWLFYGFAVVASGRFLNWTGVAAILLTALFVGSTAFTESITLAKYPRYAEYRRAVSAVVPLPPRGEAVGAREVRGA